MTTSSAALRTATAADLRGAVPRARAADNAERARKAVRAHLRGDGVAPPSRLDGRSAAEVAQGLRDVADALDPCAPTGLVSALHGQVGPSGTCACGDAVTQHWDAQAADWLTWSDVDGTLLRARPKPPVHPAIMEQMRGNKRITPQMLADYEATHWGWGVPWPFPLHWHRMTETPRYTGECPECHGWPMQAVADGWRCRVTSRMHALDESQG